MNRTRSRSSYSLAVLCAEQNSHIRNRLICSYQHLIDAEKRKVTNGKIPSINMLIHKNDHGDNCSLSSRRHLGTYRIKICRKLNNSN